MLNDVLIGPSSPERSPSAGSAAYRAAVLALQVLLIPVFYLLFLPAGLFLRALGIDFMGRRLDRSRASYWTHWKEPRR